MYGPRQVPDHRWTGTCVWIILGEGGQEGGWEGGEGEREGEREGGTVWEEGGRGQGAGRRDGGPTVCHGVQDGHAAGVLSFQVEDGSLPRDHLPHHNRKAEDVTAVRVVPSWGEC